MSIRPGWMSMYMKEHLPLYLFVSVLFVTGVVFGAVMVGALTLEQQEELSRNLSSFFFSVDKGMATDGAAHFPQMFGTNIKWLAIIWILGLSVVGLPLVFALDFIKGVLIGFTVGYMVGQYSWKGMLFALAAVVPQNLLLIPCIIVSSAMAVAFSMYLVNNRFLKRSGSLYEPFMRYFVTALSIAVLMAGISFYEAYLSPQVMKWVTPMLVALQ